MWLHRSLLLALALTFLPASAEAEDALDSTLSLGVQGAGWAGAYSAAGLGGRVGWQPFPFALVEVFATSVLVEHAQLRHDHQVGFQLSTPVRLGGPLRFRPLLGFCAVFSFIEPAEANGVRADDVLFGAHLGVGADVALGRWVSLFADLRAVGWLGHERHVERWSASIEDDVALFGAAQLEVGVRVHVSP